MHHPVVAAKNCKPRSLQRKKWNGHFLVCLLTESNEDSRIQLLGSLILGTFPGVDQSTYGRSNF
jgi:hypothetical protein